MERFTAYSDVGVFSLVCCAGGPRKSGCSLRNIVAVIEAEILLVSFLLPAFGGHLLFAIHADIAVSTLVPFFLDHIMPVWFWDSRITV